LQPSKATQGFRPPDYEDGRVEDRELGKISSATPPLFSRLAFPRQERQRLQVSAELPFVGISQLLRKNARARALLMANGHVKLEAESLRGDQFAVLKTPSLYESEIGLFWEHAECRCFLRLEGKLVFCAALRVADIVLKLHDSRESSVFPIFVVIEGLERKELRSMV
jgi:hypothetical protein